MFQNVCFFISMGFFFSVILLLLKLFSLKVYRVESTNNSIGKNISFSSKYVFNTRISDYKADFMSLVVRRRP